MFCKDSQIPKVKIFFTFTATLSNKFENESKLILKSCYTIKIIAFFFIL